MAAIRGTFNYSDIIGKTLAAKVDINIYDSAAGNLINQAWAGDTIGKVIDYKTINKDSNDWWKIWKIIEDRDIWYQIENVGWVKYDDASYTIVGDSSGALTVTTAASTIENDVKQAAAVSSYIIPVAVGIGILMVVKTLTKK